MQNKVAYLNIVVWCFKVTFIAFPFFFSLAVKMRLAGKMRHASRKRYKKWLEEDPSRYLYAAAEQNVKVS